MVLAVFLAILLVAYAIDFAFIAVVRPMANKIHFLERQPPYRRSLGGCP